ncbi:tetratricopeptide repeat protein [Cupriavidus consociatus]|uniref:tetratricopeptide repeat protein n=1 Tax=Cupriavidus consociatus TaxID=2821357 RepID=UPI001AE51F02|nr:MULTISPECIES: tetratricopeptide repeat protein [unclassified Cupriavidus]MBP0618868.1 tetratricopeptide repeat protein [Cupriavidus sp. LEh25]MDK2655509.1 tetratricopeptide repeat protein [Cupriavidus sp. LEh21]
MAHTDSRSVSVSSTNASSIERFEAALELLHGYYGDPLTVIDHALAEDPGFVMGHALRAGMMITAGDGTVVPLLRESVEAGEALSAGANERERRHIAAARAWLDGHFTRSIQLYGDIVIDYPRDSLALQVAHIGDFLLGQSTLLRDRIAQVLPHWNTRVPGFGYVLGMHAFGLEETHRYEQAEERGRFALELNPRDPWAIHAVAHVMEMQGRQDEGIDWLSGRAGDWSQDNMMAVHNWWHLALFHLELGHARQVLDIYDAHIRENQSSVALELIDACAMLWRLHLRGIDTGTRWSELADTWQARGAQGYYAFNDTHAAMAFLCAGRDDALAALLAGMRAAAAAGGCNAMMTREVGLPVTEALVAFSRRDYDRTIELLMPVRQIAHRFGGSHAQRDLINLTLIEAALRGERANLACALAAERMELKPMNTSLSKLVQRASALQREAVDGTRDANGMKAA